MSRTTDDKSPIVVLFRRDLRVADNRALAAAADTGRPIVPLFILDEETAERPAGGASRWWLHHSLAALEKAIDKLGAKLILREGATQKIVAEAIEASGATSVFWNRRYAPSEIEVDKALKAKLRGDGIEAESFEGFLLHEPSLLKTQGGDFYKVFTPFYRKLSSELEPRDPVDAPKSLGGWGGRLHSEKLSAFNLLPTKPDWARGLAERWQPGEAGAHERLKDFLEDNLDGYALNRDLPEKDGTSGLSPHLAHGEITPFQIFAVLRRRRSSDAETFRKEVVWREFCYHLLFHNPTLHTKNFKPEFDAFEWRHAVAGLKAWQRGQTGYPIVDAGMRELWQTGVMHNRVRMIAASFVIKDLLVDWREGEKWFWDTLVDADAASNPGNWQWVAGSGADASPYFRIFNPVLQGEKFDRDGDYVRRYVPEIAGLPDKYLHRPWEAPAAVLKEAGIELGKNYPKPLVDHGEARDRALRVYRETRSD